MDSRWTYRANTKDIDIPDFGYYEELNQKNELAAAQANTEELESENVYEKTSIKIEPHVFKTALNETVKAKAAKFEKFPVNTAYGKFDLILQMNQ